MGYLTAGYTFALVMIVGYGLSIFVRFRKAVAIHKALGEDADA